MTQNCMSEQTYRLTGITLTQIQITQFLKIAIEHFISMVGII